MWRSLGPWTSSPAGNKLWGRVQAWPRWLFAAVAAVTALALTTWFYPPRLEVFGKKDARFQEWARAGTFLKQSVDPLRQDVEPAMRWRLLPPMVSHALHLGPGAALTIPWIGLFALLVTLTARLETLTGKREIALAGTLGFATSGGPITIVNWLGINDAWFLLALLETATGRSRLGLLLCALLGPWVAEHYLIALPLALAVRAWLATDNDGRAGETWFGRLMLTCVGLAPYIGLRLWVTLRHGDQVSAGYVADMLAVFKFYAAYVPAGWGMGFRLLWIPLGAALWLGWRNPTSRLAVTTVAPTALAALTVISVLAWDLSRSVEILLPWYALAAVLMAKHDRLRKLWWWTLLGNLCLPYAHIVGFSVTWKRGPFGLWQWLTG